MDIRRRERAQIENRVSDQLAGAVEGDVATTVALEHFDAARGELLRRRKHVGALAVAAQGQE